MEITSVTETVFHLFTKVVASSRDRIPEKQGSQTITAAHNGCIFTADVLDFLLYLLDVLSPCKYHSTGNRRTDKLVTTDCNTTNGLLKANLGCVFDEGQ